MTFAYYLAHFQLTSGIPSGLNSIINEVRRLSYGKCDDAGYILLSAYAHNTFVLFSRQQLTDLQPSKLPSLCQYLKTVYARLTPLLIEPTGSQRRRYDTKRPR
eukprot:GFKZ01004605.1.p1 GENE.GFKZ01004605.1~~GFKZ01004605.1.p1  ORF type:complete len:103 (-),score=5.15 GFKZ01004605.1:51-359(-)